MSPLLQERRESRNAARLQKRLESLTARLAVRAGCPSEAPLPEVPLEPPWAGVRLTVWVWVRSIG